MTEVKNNIFKYFKYFLGAIFSLIFIILVIFLLNPFIFIKDLETKIANLVESEAGMNLSYENFSGNFFTGFKLESSILTYQDKQICKLKSLHVNPGIFTSIFSNHLSLDRLVLNEGNINIDYFKKNITENSQNELLIKLLELQDIQILYKNQKYLVNSKLKVQTGDINEISIFSGLFELPIWPFEIEIGNGEIEINNEYYNVSDLEIYSKYGKISLSGEFFKENLFHSFANIRLDNLELEEIVNFPLSIDNLSIMLERITPDSSIAILNGNGNINKINIDNYHLNVGLSNNNIFINSSKILYDDSKILIDGVYDLKSEIINLNTELENVYIPIVNKNLLNGNINLHGSLYSDSIFIGINLDNTKLGEYNFDEIQGDFLYADKNIYSQSNFSGLSNNVKFQFDRFTYSIIEKSVLSSGNFTVNKFIYSTNINDYIYNLNLNGEFDGDINFITNQLSVNGDVTLHDSKINGNYFGNIYTSIDFQYDKTQIDFEIEGIASNLKLQFDKHLKLDSISYDIKSSDENYFINFANGYFNKTPVLFVKETFITPTKINIKELFLNYNEIEIITEDIFTHFENNQWKIKNHPFNFNNDNIILNFNFESLQNYELALNTESIDFSLINSLISFPQRITGKYNGEFKIENSFNNYNISTDAILTNGKIDDIVYDTLNISINSEYGKINYKNIELINKDKYFIVSGEHLPNINYDEKYRFGEINLKGLSENFELEKLNNYIPISLDIYGDLTGAFTIKGTPDSPEIEMNIDVLNPQFDKIKGELLTGNIKYKDEISILENFNFKTVNGTYNGNGIVPINLNIFGRKSTYYINPKLNFSFSGQTTEFEFLTPYFDIIDSINGHININLNVTGSLKNPIRNGGIDIKHAKINLMPLENTVYGINGSAIIENNILIIEKLTGLTSNSNPINGIQKISNFINTFFLNEKNNDNPLIRTSGNMDLTDFFDPKFNFKLNSNDIYLSSINKNYKGNASADFQISGKDTIFIDGVFNPLPNKFTFLMEFEEGESLSDIKIEKGKVLSYNIHIPLENGVKIENSQMDGLIDGDIVLTAIGDEPFSFSGNINVIDGSFYFNGNTIDQISGNILLDPTEIEPIIDFYGITNVAGKDIELSLNGKMDNPNLSLESISDPDLSQDDLLYLLVFTPDSTGQDDGLIGTEQVGSLITNYVENTLERNIVRNSTLDKFQFNTQGGTLLSGFENSHLNLYLGKNISPNLYLNLRSDLNSENSTFQYEVGYRLSRNMSVIGRIDEKQLYHLTYRFKYKY